MRSVSVWLKDRSYPILIGRGIFSETGKLLRKRGLTHRHAVIVSQKPIVDLYGDSLKSSLLREGYEPLLFVTPFSKSSEASKSQAVFLKLIQSLSQADGKGKSLFLLAFGGGVVGDLTGFAASVYRRGIPYIQIPTTLTAQVDSAIGGKTAIDLPQGKNLLGAIYQPRLVLSDTALLETLPDRHWSDGFAEVIKYGVIKDPALFSILEKEGIGQIRKNSRLLEKVIQRSSKIKAKIVSQDEMDKKDIRIVLNFGHTAGHAIEAAAGYSGRYTHGEAVGIGMLVACDIAKELKILKDSTLIERIEKTLLKFNLPLYTKALSIDAILKAMGYDKKTELGVNRFVLPVSLGRTVVMKNIPAALISGCLLKRKG